MRKLATILMAVALITTIKANGQKLTAYLSYSIFNTPENKPYVETYLTIKGSSVKYVKTDNNKYQANVEVKLLFKDGDSIVNYSKYILNSPEVSDTLLIPANMLDIQRYYLNEGAYVFDISLDDINTPDTAITSVDKLNISFPDNQMTFSDIELLNSYEKSNSGGVLEKHGFKLDPNIMNYYGNKTDIMSYYTELYNTKTILGEEPFLMSIYIRPFESDVKLTEYFVRKRMKPEDVVVLLSSFNIANLATGNYILVTEAFDRNNKMLASTEKYFQRYNPSAKIDVNKYANINTQNTFVGNFNSKDTLLGYIDYLYPISTNMEKMYVKNQAQNADVDELKRFFLSFWMERDPISPNLSWEDYLRKVMEVNKDFKSVSIPGYKTDRGRVYLQYGRPNVISEQYNEPAAYPYEIWHYYKLGDQRDKKFVFYAHDVVTNDFLLLHSNAIGEVNNYRWQSTIYRRTWDSESIDDEIIPTTWGSKATETYEQPW